MPSTRSSFRARTRERGYVLITAIALAILYFALMELMLIDSSRALARGAALPFEGHRRDAGRERGGVVGSIDDHAQRGRHDQRR